MAYSQWMILCAFVIPTISGPYRWTLRLFNFQGIKPQGSLWAAMAHGTVHSWASFWGSIPQQLFAGDIDKGVAKVEKGAASATEESKSLLASACRGTLRLLGKDGK